MLNRQIIELIHNIGTLCSTLLGYQRVNPCKSMIIIYYNIFIDYLTGMP